MSSDASRKARHEFRKSPPGKAGFRISGLLLLGGCPLLFGQLQESLAAIAQAFALLDLVEHRHRCHRDLQQHLYETRIPKALAVGSVALGGTDGF